MPILALDVKTVKLIATTQIISSVYAVVKELIENSLDAGADNVDINLSDNGTSLIEVKDNGCGISKEDAPYMGLPSYTSKILNFEDLDFLQTFGFRGEALGALCAMAEVLIVTKTENDIVGSSYTMNHDGRIVKQESCHRSTGTTVQVKNLFKQIPVRRQLITNTRRANQAVKLLETLVQAFGICKPNLRIQLRVNNNVIFTKPSLNNIKEAASHIFGRKIMCHMEWVEPNNTEFTLQLMLPSKKVLDLSEISHPDCHYIFVNNRPIKHKDLEKLINSLILEYFQQESSRKKMIFLVYIILEPMDIDVNLEPNKDAILFKNQNKVFDNIDKTVRKFYGLKPGKLDERAEDVSHDTSACYEDYTLGTNEDVADVEWPACKKRRVHAEGTVAPKEKTSEEENLPTTRDNDVGNENGKLPPQDTQENNNMIDDQQHYRDALALTTHMQPPNLSDSDSNDEFPVVASSDDRDDERERLSQLPVVDLGEDFDFEKVFEKENISTNENKNNLNEIREKKQISLEAWSKGHVPGLRNGTDIKSDIATEKPSNNRLESKANEASALNQSSNRAHVDHKDLKFLKHVRSQVAKENPTLTAAQTAKKITEFWKELSSEERGYYRDVANEEEKEQQSQKQTEESAEASETDTGKKTSRLLKLFEKMKNTKNEKKEKLNMRTIVPWNIDRAKIIERSDFASEHIIGRLTSNLWIATICEQLWIVDSIRLIKGLEIIDIDADEMDAKRLETLLKQWLLERDDMSVMRSIYELKKQL